MIGHGLRSDDGGKTCWASELPDLDVVAARMLVGISHYPVVSQQAWLHAYGLRYPGDLLNLGLAHASLGLCRGPVLVVHGHLHTAVVWRDGRIRAHRDSVPLDDILLTAAK